MLAGGGARAPRALVPARRARRRACTACRACSRSRCSRPTPRSRSSGRSRRRTRGWRPTGRSPTWPSSPAASRSCGSRPAAGPALLYGVRSACVLVCAWALLTKVFPGALAADETLARLRAPFELLEQRRPDGRDGGPAAAVARRPAHRATRRVNALAWPLLGLVLVCLMLSYSRGALIALAIGLAVWFAAVPLRLRGGRRARRSALARRARRRAGRSPRTALTVDRAPMAARADAGHELGALLLLLVAVLCVAGLAVGFFTAAAPAGRAHARGSPAAACSAALALVPGRGPDRARRLAGRDRRPDARGLEPAHRPAGAHARATRPTGSPRPPRCARSTGARRSRCTPTRTLVGTGAGAYATARTRYRDERRRDRPPRARLRRADAVRPRLGRPRRCRCSPALAWLLTAARALGMRRRDRGLPFDAERVGLWTMAVGRRDLRRALGDRLDVVRARQRRAGAAARRLGRRPRAAARAARPPAAPPSPSPSPRPARARARAGGRSRRRRSAGVLAALAIATALVAAWAAYQPVRSVHAGDEALARLDRGAYEPAVATAQTARRPQPALRRPAVRARRDPAGAAARRRRRRPRSSRATEVQPANAETWRRLGQFRLDALAEPRAALKDFQAAYYLDPQNPRSWSDLIDATRAVQADGG